MDTSLRRLRSRPSRDPSRESHTRNTIYKKGVSVKTKTSIVALMSVRGIQYVAKYYYSLSTFLRRVIVKPRLFRTLDSPNNEMLQNYSTRPCLRSTSEY